MKAVLDKPEATHRIGKFEFRIVAGEPTPDFEERRARRSDAITAWLMAQWQREQLKQVAERN